MKELEIINPDIIVCGYTFGMLKTVLADELEADDTRNTMYGFWRDKLVIVYWSSFFVTLSSINIYL